jgi:hypothetical protein
MTDWLALQMILYCVGLCTFGIFFAVPLRRKLILQDELPFPSGGCYFGATAHSRARRTHRAGKAAAVLISSLQRGSTRARKLARGRRASCCQCLTCAPGRRRAGHGAGHELCAVIPAQGGALRLLGPGRVPHLRHARPLLWLDGGLVHSPRLCEAATATDASRRSTAFWGSAFLFPIGVPYAMIIGAVLQVQTARACGGINGTRRRRASPPRCCPRAASGTTRAAL